MYLKKTLFYSLFVLLISAAASCHKSPPQENNQQKIQQAVEQVRINLSDSLGISFPSLSLLIQTPKEKIFVTSTGKGGQTVTPNTYYRIASNTKHFTASAIMNMWEDGWLDYKARITDFIPGTKTSYTPGDANWDIPYKNDITIELLLQHAAGVYDVDNDPVRGYNGLTYTEAILKIDPFHQFTTGEMVKVVKDLDTSYWKPGGGYHYSNTGYSILAEIIKRVYSAKAGTSKTYADYMEDFLTGPNTPVPLSRIHFPILSTDIAMPEPHLTSTILDFPTNETYDKYNMSAQLGEGNAWTTMEQLNKYLRSQMKGEGALKPATVKLMQHDVSAANPTYGLGTSYTKNLGYGHNGARLGFLNLMSYDPDHDVSVVVMIPLYDLRTSTSFISCLIALQDAAYAARNVLGYPGKP